MKTELDERIEKTIDEMANVRILKPILDVERMPFNEYSEDAVIHFYTYSNYETGIQLKDYYIVFKNNGEFIGEIQKSLIEGWDNIKGKFELLSECSDYICSQPGIYGIYGVNLGGITIYFYKTDEEGRRERIGWVFISWKALYCL